MKAWSPYLMSGASGWRGLWPLAPCSARRSSNSATRCIAWEPKPWKRPPTSGKKRDGYEGASLVCPHCAQDARFVERRPKWCQSLLGPIRVRRPYYHCRSCRQGHIPWDRAVGLGVATLTPAASEVASLAGVQTSFAQAAEVTLQKLCGLRLSESTVERVTEA